VQLKLGHLIRWSPAELSYWTTTNSAMEAVIEVTLHIVDPDAIRRTHIPFGWHWYIVPCNQVPDTKQM
jgi:hypothetical protein